MKKYLALVAVVILAASAILGGKAIAQLITSGTEPGGETQAVAVQPSYVSGDPAYAGIQPPDDNPGVNSDSTNAVYAYYLVSGATLRGRSSTAQYTYYGSGCLYTTAGVDTQRILNTELHLPANAIIKYLRIYYNDTNPNDSVDGFLTRYTPGEAGALDLAIAPGPNAFNGGFGFTVSPEITETVNNDLYAYTLIAFPDENNVANQVCGLRIAYYTPIITVNNIYLPRVHR